MGDLESTSRQAGKSPRASLRGNSRVLLGLLSGIGLGVLGTLIAVGPASQSPEPPQEQTRPAGPGHSGSSAAAAPRPTPQPTSSPAHPAKPAVAGIQSPETHAPKPSPPPSASARVIPPSARPPAVEDAEDGDDTGLAGQSIWPADPEGIRNAIEEAMPEILECYQSWLTASPDLAGEMRVEFKIVGMGEGLGGVTESMVQDQTTGHHLFNGCVLNVMSNLAFEEPEGGGEMIVHYPFVFEPPAED